MADATTSSQDGGAPDAHDRLGSKASRRGRRSPGGTRARILTLTRALIVNKGLSAVKARTIAGEAGVSVGTVYNMFGHLDDLVRLANAETYDDLFAHQTAALEAERADNSPPRAHLLALANSYLDWVTDHHALWTATLAFNRERLGKAPDWYQAKEIALLAIVEDALGDFDHAPTGETRNHLARALWSSIHGIVSMSMGSTDLLISAADIRLQMRLIVDAVADRLESGSLVP